VTVVDILPEEELCKDAVDLTRIALFGLLKDSGVQRVQGVVEVITDTGVALTLPDGTKTELPAHTVVTAFGLRPDSPTIEALLSVIPESYFVGDCSSVGRIFTANHEAFDVAVEV
jgi:hypothetical protein